ncbi:hypothetical protein SLH49_16575 [Cognatiyoonia sp. IB215446]|uniref:hypothetical protein n=1 Tax=Cognatiyoonia sp. IB215446 TaxID=3097355 RepID=UPI002A0FA147|nr:hypothetical protein [Cognatiyoonia sp. IB215446]MDX8349601.1 hypothetical protein [Cognatiyoonia sp. IB215446]
MRHTPALITLILTLTFVLSPLVTVPFSGFRADQLPIPQINPPVQPAGYAFAIWGLIYTWLLVSALYGIWKRAADAAWDQARWPLIVSLGVGTPWLAVANTNAIWATILIFVMGLGAILALLRAPAEDRWFFRVPIGIYAGWLTAASFVALGSTAAGFDLITGPVGWAYLGILGALFVAVPVLMRTREAGYGLTLTWALAGICVANGAANWTVTALAAGGILILTGLTAMARFTAPSVPS